MGTKPTFLVLSAWVFFPFEIVLAQQRATSIENTAAAPSLNSASATNVISKDAGRHILNEFQHWAESYATAEPPNKVHLTADGLSLVAKRRRIVAELIESDPQEALRRSVPLRLRTQLPAEIVAQLEERVSGRGDFSVIATLPVAGAAKTVRPIERFATIAGQTYRAFVYGRRLTQPTRTNLPLHGVAIDGKLALDEDPEELNRENKTSGSAWTFGTKTVLFMRVNFPDDLSEPISASSALDEMNTVSDWFDGVSFHQTGLNTTITPLLTLPRTKSSYQSTDDYIGLLADARAVAKTNGFDTANFDLDCVYLQAVFFGWSGRAYVGAKGALLQHYSPASVACHEFGHNYGLMHANAWDTSSACDTSTDTIIGPGMNTEYGNYFDTMGGSPEEFGTSGGGEYQFNAYEKNLLGWLPDANVATVTTSGVYRVHAFDVPALNSNSFHALRVQKDDVRYYWLELRTLFAGYPWLEKGVLLNWSPWQNSNGGTDLLDVNPGTPLGRSDSSLIIGQTFTDPFVPLHITALRMNTDTTPVSIDLMVQLGSFPDNHPPAMTVQASATSVAPNVPVILTANASDPDGDELAYYWDYFGNEVGPSAPSITNVWSDTGYYQVRCTVSDMKGGTASSQMLVTVGSPSSHLFSGQILNQGAPVQGVRVTSRGTIRGSEDIGYTDNIGNYLLGNDHSGSRTITATKPGWTLTPANFSNPLPGCSTISNLNFSATPVGYNISGGVHYFGTVLPGVTVTLDGTNSTVTDVNGFYFFTNLPVGAYNLTASKPDYEFGPQDWSNPVVLDWQDATGKDFQRLYYMLSGIVSNLTDYTIVSIGDPIRPASGDPVDGNWYYWLPVPRGQWNLVATHPGYTILPANFSNPIVITNLTPDQPMSFNFRSTAGYTYAISGNINESGRSVTGARVNAGTLAGFSDTVGNYILTGLSNGNYQLSATHVDYTFNPSTRNITIADNDVSGQDFAARLMFWLTQMRATNSGFAFLLSGGSNRVFRIESSTNFATWTPRATVTNTIGQFDFLDASPINSRGFYRATVLP